MNDDALSYQLGIDPDLHPGETALYLYWKDMAIGIRFTKYSDLIQFIDRLPEFLAFVSADISEKYVAIQVASLDEELPKLLEDKNETKRNKDEDGPK